VNAIGNEAWVVGGPSKLAKRVELLGHYLDAQLNKLHQAETAQKSKSVPTSSSSSSAKTISRPARAGPVTKGQGPAKAKKGDAC